MPRSLAVLKSELTSQVWLPSQTLATVQETAQAWADAYGVYASDALACLSPPIPGQIDLAVIRLRDGLLPAFVAFDPATTSLAMQTAFMLFWTGFLFVGSAVVVPGTPGLAAILAGQWAANPFLASTQLAVDAHALILHAWTTTVAVGPPCSSSIT